MKHHYHTTLLFLLLTTAALAQTFKPTSHWRAGSSGSDVILDMAIDTAGNHYIVGGFTGTVDVDPGPGVYNLTMPAGHFQQDAFLLKLDPNGNFLWAKSFGGSTDDFRNATGVAVDQLGDVYVYGIYESNIKFEPTSTQWTTTATLWSPFLAKYSSSGVLQWGYGWSTSYFGGIINLDITPSNDVIAVGAFGSTFDFNPLAGSSNVNSRTSNGMFDMFLMKILPDGTIKRIRTLGGSGDDFMANVAADQLGNLYLSGSFSNTVDLQPGPGVSNFTSSNGLDCFLMKLDTAFNYKWAKPFGGQGDAYCRNLEIADSVLINFGAFNQNIDLDVNPNAVLSHSSNGMLDAFVQKIDTSGTLVWAVTFGGSGNDDVNGLCVRYSGEILLSGFFENSVDFDPSITGSYILASAGGKDAFILELQSNGNFKTAVKYGSNSPSGAFELAAVSAFSGQVIAGVTFYNTIDINPSSLVTQNVSSAGQDDMLYLKLESCTNALVQYTENVCGYSFQLPSGNTVFTSGYYLDVMLSSQGCDSTNGITLVLNPLPSTTVTQTGATFTAQPGLTYQWLNCQSNQPIAGETNQSFTATTNGQYAVMVSNGTCTDTSVCYSITNIGLHEAHLPAVSMYPNPTTGLLHIESPQPWQQVEVTDMLGRTVLTQPEPKEELDLSKLPTGMYLVKVHFKEGIGVYRVVKR